LFVAIYYFLSFLIMVLYYFGPFFNQNIILWWRILPYGHGEWWWVILWWNIWTTCCYLGSIIILVLITDEFLIISFFILFCKSIHNLASIFLCIIWESYINWTYQLNNSISSILIIFCFYLLCISWAHHDLLLQTTLLQVLRSYHRIWGNSRTLTWAIIIYSTTAFSHIYVDFLISSL